MNTTDKVLWALALFPIAAFHVTVRVDNEKPAMGHMAGAVMVVAALLLRLKKYLMERKAARDPVPGFPSAKGAHWLCGHTIMIRSSELNGKMCLAGQKEVYMDSADPETGVSSLWLFHIPSVSVLQSKDVKKILRSSSYRKSNGLVDAHIKNLLGRRNLISLTGTEWRTFRNAVHKCFTQTAVKQSQETMHEVGNAMAESLLKEIRMQEKDNDLFQPTVRKVLPLMKCATVDVFGLAILDGFDFKCSKRLKLNPLAHSFEYLLAELVRRFRRPWDPTSFLYNIPTTSNREYKRHKEHILTFIREQVAQARARIAEEEQLCRSSTINYNHANSKSKEVQKETTKQKRSSELMTNLINAATNMKASHKNNDCGYDAIVEETLEDVYMSLLFGAYDTSSITMTYALYLLATHPHIQENCVEEILTVLNRRNEPHMNNSEESGNCGISAKDLPYTKAVIMESLRLFPPAYTTRRNLEKPLKLPSNGKLLPKGQMVNISIWSIHRSEINFPRPTDIIPERWVRRRKNKTNLASKVDGDDAADDDDADDNDADDNDASSKCVSAWEERGPNDDEEANMIIAPANQDAFFAFAVGARNCVGKVFAMEESVIILACLLKKLKFDLVSSDYMVRPVICGFVQRPDDDMPMRIQERHQ
ncbi:unnamed protein product [Pseudo-nitzschia multistriata]|uniref:Cytochrome P450 n=1 Tax=Pseudo-nitzschia multistriata TaxID=183589 RepID=A0A448Z2N8_9STRA|nr:unnamed protein product [Pseudo-nitzschia multistriata]